MWITVKDIMDTYYEMLRGKNSGNKKTFSTVPTASRSRPLEAGLGHRWVK
jgi:hypothetical protein